MLINSSYTGTLLCYFIDKRHWADTVFVRILSSFITFELYIVGLCWNTSNHDKSGNSAKIVAGIGFGWIWQKWSAT